MSGTATTKTFGALFYKYNIIGHLEKFGRFFSLKQLASSPSQRNYKVSDGRTGEFLSSSLAIVSDDISPIWIINFLLNLTFGFQTAAVENKGKKTNGKK